MKSCRSHEKNKTRNIRHLVFIFSPIDLAFWCFFFCFFMWFARFQILICDWHKLLVLSWLYFRLKSWGFLLFFEEGDLKWQYILILSQLYYSRRKYWMRVLLRTLWIRSRLQGTSENSSWNMARKINSSQKIHYVRFVFDSLPVL